MPGFTSKQSRVAVGDVPTLREIEARLFEAIRAAIVIPVDHWPMELQEIWPEAMREGDADHIWSEPPLRRAQLSSERLARLEPTLLWLKLLSEDGRHIAWARALRCEWWRLVPRFGRAQETLRRWHVTGLRRIHEHLRQEAKSATRKASKRRNRTA